MEVHVLNGDALAEKFPFKSGHLVVCRECLIEGPVKADPTEQFWKLRAEFIERQYHEQPEGYRKIVQSEFEKLIDLDPDTINLWFEHDLFCQVNMWRAAFPHLAEVCEAHMQRFLPVIGRPQKKLKTILKSGVTNFEDLFLEFQKTESIYGFGDQQVRDMLADVATQ